VKSGLSLVHVKVRWYDVEAFSTKASDIAVFETTSLQDYYFVIDATLSFVQYPTLSL